MTTTTASSSNYWTATALSVTRAMVLEHRPRYRLCDGGCSKRVDTLFVTLGHCGQGYCNCKLDVNVVCNECFIKV
jgi:hypothetical protein